MVLSRKKIKRNNKIFSQRISTYKKIVQNDIYVDDCLACLGKTQKDWL